MFHQYFLNGSFKYKFWLRLAKSDAAIVRFLAKLMHWRLSRKYLIQIPCHTQIGHGLYISHSMFLVVNEAVVLGNNINLSQFKTIGANHYGIAVKILK